MSSWEHLQNTLNQVQNRIVREEFNDISGGDDDITTPRSSLRTACLLRDSDSATITLNRLFLFYFLLRKAQDLQIPVYGIPTLAFQESRAFVPQLQLYFQEDRQDIEPGYTPVVGEISIRLMGQTPETLTEAEIRSYANRVRQTFAIGAAFIWRKGKVLVSYTDKARGYQLQLLVRNEGEGRRIIEAVLDLQNHSPDWQFMNVTENQQPASRFPTIPGSQTILGRSRRKPRKRPIADVRFVYALVHIHGIQHPIVLLDRSGVFRNPILEAA